MLHFMNIIFLLPVCNIPHYNFVVRVIINICYDTQSTNLFKREHNLTHTKSTFSKQFFDHEIILSRGHSINFVNLHHVTFSSSNHFGIQIIWNHSQTSQSISIHVLPCHFTSFHII